MKTTFERTESINEKVKEKQRRRKKRIAVLSAVLSFVCVLTVVCSIPIIGENAPNVNAYRKDAYFPLIEKINDYKNSLYNYEKQSVFGLLGDSVGSWFGGMPKDDAEAPDTAAPDSKPTSPSDNRYEETTLNQVEGVVEGDILKRSSTHAYYLRKLTSSVGDPEVKTVPCFALDVYELDKQNTSLLNTHYVYAKDGAKFTVDYWNAHNGEMYLEVDGDTTVATVITNCVNQKKVTYTCVISLDVSDPFNVFEISRSYITGAYLSSRKVNGNLLVATNFLIGGNTDYEDKSTYVPSCGDLNTSEFLDLDKISMPEELTTLRYTVLALLNEKTLEVKSNYALLSYSQEMNVSNDYVFVTRNKGYIYRVDGAEISHEEANRKGNYERTLETEIVALSYKNGFEKVGCVSVDGTIKDRYSMDENNGVLRVFTSTDYCSNGRYYDPVRSASLTCFDLKDGLKKIAEVKNFAPQDEQIKSARFQGNVAYACTAVELRDPVFAFDLSDYNNITCKHTGEISGFSVSLIPFGGYLLGIGVGDSEMGVQFKVYQTDEAAGKVVQKCTYDIPMCRYSSDYKAHFVDAERKLVGLEIVSYENTKPENTKRYVILKYNELTNEFDLVSMFDFDTAVDHARAFYDEGVYVFGYKVCQFVTLPPSLSN